MQIIDHRFITGERVLDLDELKAEIADRLEEAERAESEEATNDYISNLISAADAWALMYNAEGTMKSIQNDLDELNTKIADAYMLCSQNANFEDALNALKVAADALAQAKADAEAGKDAGDVEAQDTDEGGENVEGDEEETPVDPVAQAQAAYDAAFAAFVEQTATFYAQVLLLLDCSVELNALKANADALVEAMPKALEIMESTYVYDEDEETRTMLLAQMQGYMAKATTYVSTIATAYAQYAQMLAMDGNADTSIFAATAELIDLVFVQNVYGAEEIEALKEACANYIFDMETLKTLYDSQLEDGETEAPEVDDSDKDQKYVVDNNRIVAVTYGEGEEAYKTFILNYNSYSVRVTYKGVVYTIESGEYIVVFENENA